MCKRGKHTKGGHFMMNRQERSIRTAWRAQRLQEDPVVSPAPTGYYFD
jgi:hypothetical protein